MVRRDGERPFRAAPCPGALGYNGGGPRFLAELAQAMALRHPQRVELSFNARADVALTLRGVATRPHVTTTYRNRLGVVLGVARLPVKALRFRRYLVHARADTVVCAMESVYQSLIVPLVSPRSMAYVLCVHDAEMHPGERHWITRPSADGSN